ncbi:UNVERIFIED_CONTAM: hypothetical protein K2H54_025028 [Gekko kuhli]
MECHVRTRQLHIITLLGYRFRGHPDKSRIQLIRDLIAYDVQLELLKGLVSLLKPSRQETAKLQARILEEPGSLRLMESLPAYPCQQAAAAKAIGIPAQDSNRVAEELISLNVVPGLVCAMGNKDHTDCQRQASITLESHCNVSLQHFVKMFLLVEETVRRAMGEKFFQLFVKDPTNLYLNMDAVQADILVTNIINMPGDLLDIANTELPQAEESNSEMELQTEDRYESP